MKALSLWQPWATLVAIESKMFETRHWSTSYRGPLAIHAAKKETKALYALSLSEPFASNLVGAGYKYNFSSLPFGAFVAVADLVDIFPTETIVNSIGEDERAFGDYSPGRFAWKLENLRRIEPLPAPGHQGLWNIDSVTLTMLLARIH